MCASGNSSIARRPRISSAARLSLNSVGHLFALLLAGAWFTFHSASAIGQIPNTVCSYVDAFGDQQCLTSITHQSLI